MLLVKALSRNAHCSSVCPFFSKEDSILDFSDIGQKEGIPLLEKERHCP